MGITLEKYEKLRTAKQRLKALVEKLKVIHDWLGETQKLLMPDEDATLDDLIAGLGIELSVEGENLDINDWSDEQKQEIYAAVMAMVRKFAAGFDGDLVFGLLLFQQVFGDVTFVLTPGSDDDNPTAYASTGSDGSIITWYTKPDPLLATDINAGRDTAFYTKENIVHEFGHVLINHYLTDYDDLYSEWEGLFLLIDKFDTDEGWANGLNSLQNKITLEDLKQNEENPNPPTRYELENERIANMFEAWVYGRTPDINSKNTRQQRAAWAMWLYMTGIKPPKEVAIRNLASLDRQPCYGEDEPCPRGFFEWLLEVGGQNNEN